MAMKTIEPKENTINPQLDVLVETLNSLTSLNSPIAEECVLDYVMPTSIANESQEFKSIYRLLYSVPLSTWRTEIVEKSIHFGQLYFDVPFQEWKPEWKATIGSSVEASIARNISFIRLATREDKVEGKHNPPDFVVSDEAKGKIYRLEGKSSTTSTTLNFLIPPAHVEDILLLTHVDATKQRYKVGLLQCTDKLLKEKGNRDKKRSLTPSGKKEIRWFVNDAFTIPPYVGR